MCSIKLWLPYEKIRTDTVILLDKLGDMKVSQAVWGRGHEYYMGNHVRYISVDDGRGRAIVEGERAYEVEFDFADGEIRNLYFVSCICVPLNFEFSIDKMSVKERRRGRFSMARRRGNTFNKKGF